MWIQVYCAACLNLATGTFQEYSQELRLDLLHQAVNFEYGLQGVEVSCSQDVASDLVSPNCHRVHLQRFGISTFLNLQDTAHACQLHQFSPVLHPLLSEIMMGNESQHWWLLDSGAAATVMATASRATYGVGYRSSERPFSCC